MKIPSQLLSNLAGNTKEGTELDSGDLIITIPNVIQPIIQLPFQIGKAAGFSASANEVMSRVSNANTNLGAAASTAAQNATIITFKRGLWQITITASFVATWTQALDGTIAPAGRVELVDDASAGMQLIQFNAVNLQPQTLFYTAIMHFPIDGWLIRAALIATGVGQTMQIATSVYAARLQ
jgi:hypothetical protein